MDIKTYNQYLFKHPFTCIVNGPTGCGKTHLLFQILENTERLFDLKPERIVYCYSEYQPIFSQYKNTNIEFNEGVIEKQLLDPNIRNLIIFDDLMDDCSDNSEIRDLFTKGSHHRNISVIMLTQNLFCRGKHFRTMSLNTHYMIVFKNPRDSSQIKFLSRQMFPNKSKFLNDAYYDATKNGYSYLFLDTSPSTNDDLRVQTDIININRIVYIKK